MKERLLTCIVCPKGCQMTVSLSAGGEILSISGNTCPRGIGYAESECKNPVRTLTTTVFCEGGEIISVKTASPIPKELMFLAMAEINEAKPESNVKIGDVIVKNVAGSGVDVVATSNA